MMDNSTPIAHKRRSVLAAPQLISSPLRKTILGKTAASALESFDEQQQEQERSSRRSAVAIQKKLVEINPSTPSFTETTHFTGENEIQDHLRICAKLFTDNKISSKNAWELHVIDIIRKITSGDTENVFQVVGTSLDIGTKVYSLRVDDIYERGLKLVSKMSSQDASTQQNNADVSMNVGIEGDINVIKRKRAAKKKKVLHKDKKCTIEKDKSHLFAEIKVLEPPLFRTKENIDTSAVDNLLTIKLQTDPATHQLALLSSKKYWNDEPDQILTLGSKVVDIELPKVTDFTLCQHFKDFEIFDWKPEDEENHFTNSPMDDVVVDDQGIPIPELDGSVHDIFQNGDEDCMSDDEQIPEAFHAQIHEGVGGIVDVIPEGYRVATDYAFNTTIKTESGKLVYKLWAGPSHWKVKFNKRSVAKFTGRTEQIAVRQPKKNKVPEPIDFHNLELEKFEVKYTPQVNKRAPATSAIEKILLPEIYPEDYQRVMRHFLLKPDMLRPVKVSDRRQRIDSVDADIPVYNYDNPNDSQYLSQHDDEGHDNEQILNSFEENGPLAAQENFCAENLVEAPVSVFSQPLLYSLHAKKMDMKKLKAALWKNILRNKAEDDVEAVKFSTVYRELPFRLNADMIKDLTCPLAFVGLLHLCNENNLLLTQENSMDFIITKAIFPKS